MPASIRPGKSGPLPYRPHIDGLRGVAVLMVVFYHAFPTALRGGFIGVDVFFVISGFLISSILYAEFNRPGSNFVDVIGRFYARRVRRIFPALIVVLVATLTIGFFLLLPSELERLARHALASTGFYLNITLAGQVGYFDTASASNPLLHLWSLAVEEQFYLVWPLLVWVAVRCRLQLLPVAMFFAASSFFWSLLQFPGNEAAAFYLPQMRLWELLVGAAAAAAFPLQGSTDRAVPRRKTALNQCWAALGLGSILAGLFLIKSEAGFDERAALLPTIGAACVVCSSGSTWVNRALLSRGPLVWIGLISYPLYLWHWPLLSFAHVAGDHSDSPALKLPLILLAIGLAWLTYQFIEKPLRHRRASVKMVGALLGGMAAIAVAAWCIQSARGFPGRFPSLISQISTYEYDHGAATRIGTYFLMGDRDETDFKQDPNEIQPDKPTIYLWGDSHAACLYSGLNHVYGESFNIVQRTAAKTPPLMAEFFNTGVAQQINRFVFESIVRDQPEIVVLDANWQGYEWEKIETTIVALKAARISQIVLIGPVPQWVGSLPQQLFNYVRKHRDEPVPVRMKLTNDSGTAEVDQRMAELCQRHGIQYISPWKIFGNEEGFLVRTGDTPDTLITYDQSHLTPQASIYLVSHFPEPLGAEKP